MINDAEKGHAMNNCCIRIVVVDDKPRLCIFATKEIRKGQELRYDYGVPSLPWRKVNKVKGTCIDFNNLD